MFIKMRRPALAAALPVGVAGVSLGLCKCGVSERGHDVVGAAASVGEHPAQRLAQAARLAR